MDLQDEIKKRILTCGSLTEGLGMASLYLIPSTSILQSYIYNTRIGGMKLYEINWVRTTGSYHSKIWRMPHGIQFL